MMRLLQSFLKLLSIITQVGRPKLVAPPYYIVLLKLVVKGAEESVALEIWASR